MRTLFLGIFSLLMMAAALAQTSVHQQMEMHRRQPPQQAGWMFEDNRRGDFRACRLVFRDGQRTLLMQVTSGEIDLEINLSRPGWRPASGPQSIMQTVVDQNEDWSVRPGVVSAPSPGLRFWIDFDDKSEFIEQVLNGVTVRFEFFHIDEPIWEVSLEGFADQFGSFQQCTNALFSTAQRVETRQ